MRPAEVVKIDLPQIMLMRNLNHSQCKLHLQARLYIRNFSLLASTATPHVTPCDKQCNKKPGLKLVRRLEF